MKKIVIFFALFACAFTSDAQLSFTNGSNTLEIGGLATTYYNYRFYKPGQTDFKKNRFKLRDAQLKLEGRKGTDVEYELQIDFANLFGNIDPENPPLMDAFVMYKGLGLFDIKAGFQKLPYSRTSLNPFVYSPYFQRAEFARGEIFSRRDIGVTLSQSFWGEKINVYAGIYNGIGEQSLTGNNSIDGNLEYIGRVDVSWPVKSKYRNTDINISPIPMYSLGLNARYTEKGLTTGSDYSLLTVEGTKTAYGVDFYAQYRGFSILAEAHQMRVTPNDSLRFFGIPDKKYFLAGGVHVEVGKYIKPLKSILSARYENYNLNNLYDGTNERLAFAYAYMIDGWNSTLKIQYSQQLTEEQNATFPEAVTENLNYTGQLRLGWQYRFN
jgi:hypothetical protein